MPSQEQSSTEHNSSINSSNSRRKFFKKATVGSALIASAASQPVWGSCVSSISGNLSGNVSTQEAAINTFAGRQPRHYRNVNFNIESDPQDFIIADGEEHIGIIPAEGVIIGTSFITYSAAVSETINYINSSSNTVQFTLVDPSTDPNDVFERVYLTALLNSNFQPGYPYTVPELESFLSEVNNGNITLNEATIVLINLINTRFTSENDVSGIIGANDVCE